MNHRAIVEAAAIKARAEVNKLSLAGVCVPHKLIYRIGELALIPEYADTPEGFKDSGRLLPISTPYQAYYRWIERNSMDLAILDTKA